jgi:hypothetical protein
MRLFLKSNNSNKYYTPQSTLSELANKFETDKGTSDSLNLSWGVEYSSHRCMHYTVTYEKYMNEKRNENINMLEVGVCDKRFPYASVKMWKSYFKNVDFYAVDNFWGHKIDDKLDDIKKLNNDSVNFIYADQGSFEDWDEINQLFSSESNKFDFLVEDGSHWPNHMMVSLWKSIKILKPGAYYFMEDIQNPLKSRGWFKYDNALIAEEFLQTLSTGVLYSSFLNDQQNKDIQDNFELVEIVLDPSQINYLAVLRKK